QQVTFVAGPPDPYASTIAITSASSPLTADGTATATVTVTVADAGGNPLAGQTVTPTVTPSSGVSALSPQPTNANGQAVFSLKSTTAETKTFSASVPASSIVRTAQATFVAGAASAASSALTIGPSVIGDDGLTHAY